LIKQKPGFSGKMFWFLEIPFKTGFTVYRIFLISVETWWWPLLAETCSFIIRIQHLSN